MNQAIYSSHKHALAAVAADVADDAAQSLRAALVPGDAQSQGFFT
jgi:hypothetical protein